MAMSQIKDYRSGRLSPKIGMFGARRAAASPIGDQRDGGAMTRLGFLLDSDSCIGCHACTIACKSEHDVPLGVNRTWVKYIETGNFPNVSRHFSVMRCNQCDDAPCMTICPTSALFRADNGVVDFQDDNCIGCKACMNACPYDALFINPETNTANKCNFCNHRIEMNLEPSCVVVCPTQAIKVVDLDDPLDPVGKIIGRSDVAVRSPEQNTKPKVYYKGADQASLDPTRTAIAADGMIWADLTKNHPTPPSMPDDAGVVARTAYTTPHKTTWNKMVSGYLVTKAIAGGIMMVAAMLALLGHSGEQAAVGLAPPIVAGIFLAITGALLVFDLKQPKRFFYLLTRGNTTSWLVKGAIILGVFAAGAAAWGIAGLADADDAIEILSIPVALLGAATAGYTAYLFAQCEGRDLWQTPLLLPMLLARAVVAGASAYAILDLGMNIPSHQAVWWTLLGGVVVVGFLTVVELAAHGSRHVELALHAMTEGEHSNWFLSGQVFGIFVPVVLINVALATDTTSPIIAAVAGVSALVGMWLAETAFVRAGQSVPLS
jgi:Fe-S-cluster-containing dehydrogenase component/formate-dependent nitrite reductase membrane component NrfD